MPLLCRSALLTLLAVGMWAAEPADGAARPAAAGAAAGAVEPVAAPAAASGMAPAGGVAAPAPRKYVPGCLARIFILPADTEWPPKELPKAPAEVLKLPAIPTVAPDPAEKKEPNLLVKSKLGILDGVRFYAVQFEGYLYAPEDGDYGLVVRSDDPYVLTIADQEILRSAYFFDFSPRLKEWSGALNINLPADVKWTNTTQGTITLGGGKYYQIRLTAFQQHGEYSNDLKPSANVLRAMGAELMAAWTTPGGESAPLQTFLPEKPAAAGASR